MVLLLLLLFVQQPTMLYKAGVLAHRGVLAAVRHVAACVMVKPSPWPVLDSKTHQTSSCMGNHNTARLLLLLWQNHRHSPESAKHVKQQRQQRGVKRQLQVTTLLGQCNMRSTLHPSTQPSCKKERRVRYPAVTVTRGQRCRSIRTRQRATISSA
jgi:hypothetical protein